MNIFGLLAAGVGLVYIFFMVITIFTSNKFDYKRIITISALSMVVMLTIFLFGIVFTGWELLIVPSIFIVMNAGVMFISWLFARILDYFEQPWLQGIYYIGLVLTVITSVLFVSGQWMYDGYAVTVGIGVIFISTLILVCSLPFIMVAKFIQVLRGRPAKTYQASMYNQYKPKKNKERMAHYREQGLNDQEITYLRQELAVAKERIIHLEKTMNVNAKLRSIENRHNLLEVCKQFFKDIVAEPKRFGQAGLFLNKLLPSIEDIASKYLEMNDHVAKTKQTYMILEKSALTIDQLAQSIVDQYLSFHQSTFDELDDEIKLAQKNLAKVQKTSEETLQENLVDELVSDPFDTMEE